MTVNGAGGQECETLLTAKATKEIAGRYGGLENLGDKLMKSENFTSHLVRFRRNFFVDSSCSLEVFKSRGSLT